MTPLDAAKLLEVAADATPEQLETRFLELRARLEDKIAKAPTSGLKAKYRESLEQITAAFETLTLAADSSTLPVLNKSVARGGSREPVESADPGLKPKPPAPGSATPATSPSSSSRKKKSNFEFLIVALLAIAVLGAGGWFVMKTRAEAAEKKRLEAKAQHEAEQRAVAEKTEQSRQAEATRLAQEQARRDSEAKRLAEEQERARRADEAKAEAQRQEARAAELRSALVELKLAWEATEQDARAAERRAAQMRSDIRNAPTPAAVKRAEAEAIAQQEFADWFASLLSRHPARIARVQAEELLSARQYDSAAAAVTKARTAQQTIDAEIAAAKKSFFTLTTSLRIEVIPATATWELTDAYGAVHQGSGAAKLDKLPFGTATLRASLDGYAAKQASTTLLRDQVAAPVSVSFAPPRVDINTIPQGATIRIDGISRGVTPLLAELPKPGKYKIEVDLAGHRPATSEISVVEGESAEQAFYMLNDAVGVTGVGVVRGAPDAELKIGYLYPSGPADEAGLQKDMVITGLERDGKFVSPAKLSLYEILGMLSGKPGTELRLTARAGSNPAREYKMTRGRLAEVENTAKTAGLIRFFNVILPAEDQHPTELRFADGRRYVLGNGEYCAVRLPSGLHTFSLQTGRVRFETKIFVWAGDISYYTLDPLNKRVPYQITPAEGGATAVAAMKKIEALPAK